MKEARANLCFIARKGLHVRVWPWAQLRNMHLQPSCAICCHLGMLHLGGAS